MKDYSLKEYKGIRKLLYDLFSTTNQPYKPQLKVKCKFLAENGNLFVRMLLVEHGHWHFEYNDNNILALIIDKGDVTLPQKIGDILGYRFFARGTPPLHYSLERAMPLTEEEYQESIDKLKEIK